MWFALLYDQISHQKFEKHFMLIDSIRKHLFLIKLICVYYLESTITSKLIQWIH